MVVLPVRVLTPTMPAGLGPAEGDAAPGGAGADADDFGRLGGVSLDGFHDRDVLARAAPGEAGRATKGGRDAALDHQHVTAGVIGFLGLGHGGLTGHAQQRGVIGQVDRIDQQIGHGGGRGGGNPVQQRHGAADAAGALQPDHRGGIGIGEGILEQAQVHRAQTQGGGGSAAVFEKISTAYIHRFLHPFFSRG